MTNSTPSPGPAPRPGPAAAAHGAERGREAAAFSRRHLRVGWIALALFVTLGMVLEALHAFKIQGYLDVDSGTRRLMWTLAHSHGTLLGLVNLAHAALYDRIRLEGWPAVLVSHFLVGATVLVPGGFFLGGVSFRGGDPGLGVLLVPIGGAMLVTALIAIAWATRATR